MGKRKNKTRAVNAKGRNESNRFVQMDHYMLNSPAYRLLSPPARALLVEFLLLYNGINNGELFMSQRDAATALGIKTHGTAAKYIQELEKRGFIKTIMPGSFSMKVRHASRYELTMKKVGDKPPTKEFMSAKRLTDFEKQRAENLIPPWRKKRPGGGLYRPDHGNRVSENQTRSSGKEQRDVGDKQTTYNIPRSAGNDDAETDQKDAA